jgi:hypothetical protein
VVWAASLSSSVWLWPFPGLLLFAECHARLERRYVRYVVRVASGGEGDRLQRTLDVKVLQVALADA